MARPSTEQIGAAIASVLSHAGVSQSDLARRLTARGWTVDQSRVSKWVRGVAEPHALLIYPAIEEECDAPRGTIFRRAGFVDDNGTDVRAAVSADDRLSPAEQAMLIDIYEAALSRPFTPMSHPEWRSF